MCCVISVSKEFGGKDRVDKQMVLKKVSKNSKLAFYLLPTDNKILFEPCIVVVQTSLYKMRCF